jgi:hypothetical protein
MKSEFVKKTDPLETAKKVFDWVRKIIEDDK